MSGAPSLSGESGKLIGVLDACLKDGFGSVTLNSLVINNNVATATVSSGHNFSMIGSTGPVILISGASPSELNTEWRIATVPNSTTFTFATSGISNQTATGTIAAKRSSAGFSKTYSGTNLAAYRSDKLTSSRLYLRVDDTGTTHARCVGYETMTDVNSGTNPFPTSAQINGGVYWIKSSSANSTIRDWFLVSNGHISYLYIKPTTDNYVVGHMFGDIISYVPSDAYNAIIQGATGAYYDGGYNFHTYIAETTALGHFIARGINQVVGSATIGKCGNVRAIGQTESGKGNFNFPNSADGSLITGTCLILQDASSIRGVLPGWYSLPQNQPMINNTTIYTMIGDEMKELVIFSASGSQLASSGRVAIDITGPWL